MPMPSIQEALALQRTGRLPQAELMYRQILARRPNDAPAQHLLGLLCHQSGRTQEALQLIRASIRSDPGQADFYSNLAAILGSAGDLDRAVEALRRAIVLRPNHGPSHHNLGVTLEKLGRSDEAEQAYRRAVELQPREARFHHHLGNALRKQQRLEEAALAYRQALSHDPKLADAYTCLAAVVGQRGLAAEAIAYSRKAVELNPDDASAHSNLLFVLQYDETLPPERLFDEHLAWASRHEMPVLNRHRTHANDPSPERRLRLGYVSADFREHTRMRFMEPVLAKHDHESFEVFCYSDVTHADATTERIRRHATVWRETAHLAHEQLAQLIEQDGIDIMIELTGHMGANRLPMFARKPAPLQIAYPGYPATTALSSIDFLITDALRDPPGSERFYTEKLLRLEPTSQCYWPGEGGQGGPSVGPVPSLSAGHVTFGSLNKPIKANAGVMAVWAKILSAVPGSRLALLASELDRDGHPQSMLTGQFAELGIDPARVLLIPSSSRARYLEAYGQIDIALDPWPYNGHTTTLDALWMGVPVVALDWPTHVGRESSCALKLLGLTDCVAHNADHYASIAAAKAADLQALTELRLTLRERMQRSCLCDGAALTRRVEENYRNVWRNWCVAHTTHDEEFSRT